MSDAYILCLHCRSTFTPEQTKGCAGCPNCGSASVPADTREKSTITLTHHEWRILFMWADNWAQQCARSEEGSRAPNVVKSIIREAQRQDPTLPALTLMDEVQDVADSLGTRATVVQGECETEILPKPKH